MPVGSRYELTAGGAELKSLALPPAPPSLVR
jgi:hypothetical protein